MTADPAFIRFQQDALSRGFDEVTERRWDPDTVLGTHTHPFAVEALVVQGEMWLSCGEGPEAPTQHLRAGDRFELERDRPHAERYGAEGATYWVARRHRG